MVWMSFRVRRPVSDPRIRKILFSTECFLLDEFSSKTACVMQSALMMGIGLNRPNTGHLSGFKLKGLTMALN